MSEAETVDRKNAGNAPDVLGKVVALISVIILAGTFIFSVIQYRSQQGDLLRHEQVDQLIKVQSQMRNDSDAISQFPNTKMTISGAEFLLGDLEGLLQSKIDVDGSKSNSALDDRRRISKTLYDLVNQDCNFNEQRDVDFSVMVLDKWSDYQQHLKGDHDLIWDLLAKYQDALSNLSLPEKFHSYFSQMRYNKDESKFVEPDVTTPDTSRFRHFEALVRGYKKHLDLVDPNTPVGLKLRRSLIEAFQASTCNQQLTDDLFGWSVVPLDPLYDPKLFAPCKR